MRAEAWILLAGLALGGCRPVAMLARPEGDGGWSEARRGAELERRADAAAVTLAPDGAAPAPAPRAAPLTLAEAVRLAAGGNRRLAEARQQLAIARARVAEARGRLFPSTIATGRYAFTTDAQRTSVALPPGLLPAGTAPPAVTIRDRDLGTLNGTVTLPLDLSGELRWALASAQAGYRGEAARLWATTLEQDVVVIGAYYTLLEAEKLRHVTTQTIALQREQLSHAQERFDSGRLTKNELLVVQVGLQDAEQELRRRDLAIDEARWALNDAIGLPVDAPTEVADVRERPTLPLVAEALRTAYRENPALRALVEEQQRLEASAVSLSRSRLPRFSGGGAVDASTTEVADPQTTGTGFVGFVWDLDTDTRTRARLAEAHAAAEKNRLRVEGELRELERAVRATWGAAAERLAALATAETAVGQAEENLRIRRQQFDVGRAASDDVLDAQRLLSLQRATLATARYQAQTRRAELQALMGQPVTDLLADGR
ncbi:MAG: TolC family protein [Deltaproteobacteria bacterium]|nr:TolC family protein [Deltaproteobacteria bacterium]